MSNTDTTFPDFRAASMAAGAHGFRPCGCSFYAVGDKTADGWTIAPLQCHGRHRTIYGDADFAAGWPKAFDADRMQ